ncbi:hypothetical protein QE419_002415 [Brevundimonas vesicularis]|uniref:hypothetical protein n=1 Tax=Brevundimonas vesicularis TaxID=41276 RepID=UPI00277E1E41|nr:hypothetical protein [Brevundimonas vesicularis]MDQ1193649.1 hypothetical protein [Brevundimonas vesicularis]
MAVLKTTSPKAEPTAPTPMPCRIVPSASARTPVAPGRIFVVMGALLKSNPADTKAEGKRRRR